MIKINLLENHQTVPETHRKTAGESTGETVIKKEARKSSRFLLYLVISLIIIIGLSIAGYIFRYEVVSFAEQYTGPLNLLEPVEPEISADRLEELRRERIRTQYMVNTYSIQTRNQGFLERIDSIDQSVDPLWISSFSLDVNDFKIEIYGRNEKVFTDFTKQVVLAPNVESVKPSDSKATSVMRGYSLKKTITGSLRVISESKHDTAVTPLFLSKDSVILNMNSLAAKTGIKLKAESQLAQNKGVIMNKFSGHVRAEGLSSQLMLFLREFNLKKLNCEWVKYDLTYTVQKGKRKTKPDTLLMDFEILIPNKPNDTPSSGSSNP